MTENDFDVFADRLNEMVCGYLRRIEGDELAAYFRHLARFPVETVIAAIAMAPDEHPAFLPKFGEMAAICERIAIDQRGAVDSVKAVRAAAACDHEYDFEPEPPGGLYCGFKVCRCCGHTIPQVNQAAPPIHLEYFRMAVNPKGDRYASATE